jgi:hypothetical protein
MRRADRDGHPALASATGLSNDRFGDRNALAPI